MSKQKISITDEMYQLSKEKYRGYELIIKPDFSQQISHLFEQSNTEIVLNFNDKKDKRQDKTKQEDSCLISFNGINKSGKYSADFTFNQNPDSKTVFSVGAYTSPTDKKTKNGTFNFNGYYESFSLSDNTFSHLNLNGLKVNDTKGVSNYDGVKLNSSTLESCNFINKNYLNFKELRCKNLQKIDIDNTQNTTLDFSNVNLPNIKEINVANTKTLQFSFGDKIFNSLKLNSSTPSYYTQPFYYDWDNFKDLFNTSCVFSVDKDTIIRAPHFLPTWVNPNGKIGYGNNELPANLLFPSQANNSKITFTVGELLQAMYSQIKETHIKSLNDTENQIAKLIKKSPQSKNHQKIK